MSPPTPLPLTVCSCKLWQKTNKHPFILVSVDLSCRSVSRQCTLRSRWTLVHRVCKLHSCLHKAFGQLWRHTFAHLLVPCSSTPSGLIITLPCFSKKSGLLFLVNSCLPRTLVPHYPTFISLAIGVHSHVRMSNKAKEIKKSTTHQLLHCVKKKKSRSLPFVATRRNATRHRLEKETVLVNTGPRRCMSSWESYRLFLLMALASVLRPSSG